MTQETKKQYNPFTRPKFAAMERFVCSYLIESLNNVPLQSVLFICRAGLLLTEKEVETLDLDMKAITSVYTVAERLESAQPGPDGNSKPVHFTSLDYDYDIKPWIRQREYGYYNHGIDLDELAEGSKVEALFLTFKRLSPSGYRQLVSDFLLMATPFAQKLGGTLTALISPETYTNMLQMYKGVKHD